MFLFSCIATVYISIRFLLPLQSILPSIPEKFSAIYPDDLIISIQKGQASTNVEEPYTIPFSSVSSVMNDIGNSSDFYFPSQTNLLVIDTNAAVEDFDSYNAMALLTRTSFSFKNNNGRIETYFLKDVEEFTLSKQTVTAVAATIAPFMSLVLPGISILLFVSLVSFFIAYNLLRLLVMAVLIVVGSLILSIPITYQKAYQVGMHSIAVSTTILSLLNILNIHLSFPFLETIIVSIWSLYMIRVNKKTLSSPVKTIPSKPPSS